MPVSEEGEAIYRLNAKKFNWFTLGNLFLKKFSNVVKDLLRIAISAAIKAGAEILKVYEGDFGFESKADSSPLTVADLHAHNVIKQSLEGTEIPMLSEEGKLIDYNDRKSWQKFWLIDPLDGTKEFIKRNGEFTVNIALVENGVPQLGVVYIPVTKNLYFAAAGEGSYLLNDVVEANETYEFYRQKAVVLDARATADVYTIVASRTHSSPETETFIQEKTAKHGQVTLASSGSSIKLCMVAEGKAHVYPRLAPTMEWDTAAGHAVVKFAGGRVYNFKTGAELQYNKENLLNPWFVVEGQV